MPAPDRFEYGVDECGVRVGERPARDEDNSDFEAGDAGKEFAEERLARLGFEEPAFAFAVCDLGLMIVRGRGPEASGEHAASE